MPAVTRFSEYLASTARDPLRQRIVCAVLLALLFLPFINKAIHIDDVAFLRLGDFFGWNPLQAFPHDYLYQGSIEVDLSPYVVTHPLLIPYVLKVLQHFFGLSEIWLHLAFLIFPALALWSLARISSFWRQNREAGSLPILILFCSLPAFIVNGQNLMTDVPTLAFLLAATAAMVQGATEEKSVLAWWGGFWLGCAIFSSYQAMVFIPVLLWFVMVGCQDRRQRRRLVCALLLPAAVMFGWLLLVYVKHGVFPLLQSQVRSSVINEIRPGLQLQVLWSKAFFALVMTGASLLFVLPVRFCRVKLCHPKRKGYVLLVLVAAFFLVAPEAGGVSRRIVLAFFGALGLSGLGLAFMEIGSWYSRQETRALAVLCGSWIGVTLLANIFVLPFGSARYLLPLFPMLFLVLLRAIDGRSYRFPRCAAALLLCSLLWGGANAWADYYHAGTYRTMAEELAALRQAIGNERQIWYIGEWGMRHYFDQAGARYLLADSTEPKAGDFVVIPEMPRFWAPSPRLQPRLSFYASREFRSPIPLRLFNRRSGAGFYCHHWGLLPFAFSSEPDEAFIIQEVR